MPDTQSGFADVNGAKLYYELAGDGTPLVMIHAGIADNRMWNNEFSYFAKHYKVLRFDMRGYGKSEPVDGEFNIQDDLVALLQEVKIGEPAIIMGCSMGGGLAIDYALTHPDRVKSLILVGSAPDGLWIDADDNMELLEQAEAAYKANELDLATELETQHWIEGRGRTKDDIDPEIRKLAYEMNRTALGHAAKNIGKHVRKQFDKPAAERLAEISVPVLIVIGENDENYLLMAADHMNDHFANSTKVLIPDAGHLPNMEHPDLFQKAVNSFLTSE